MKTGAKKTKYWHALKYGRIQCDLCPRFCKLTNGQRGFCQVRGCENDEIVLFSYGKCAGLAVDPVEKKPLYHFYPGSTVLSFGTIGCNLSCIFCQNCELSRAKEGSYPMREASAEDVIDIIRETNSRLVAFTYNEPIIFMEYARDVAFAAHKEKMNTIAITAGYITDEAREEFFSFIDAANVDLKSFSEGFYKKYTGSHLKPVLETLKYIKNQTKAWLEITTLLIPGLNDSERELHSQCEWIVENLGKSVPIHFSAFHPAHKMMDVQPASFEILQKARNIALSKGINYVYTGNVYDPEGSNTYCPKCNKLVIERGRFLPGEWNLDSNGKCVFCKTKVEGRFLDKSLN